MSESTSAPWALNYTGLSNPNGLGTYLDQVSQLRGLIGRDGQVIQAAPASGPGIWNWNNPVGTSSLPSQPPAPAIAVEEGASYSPDYVPGMTSPDTPQARIARAGAEGAKAGFGPVPGWQDIVYRPATTVIEAPFKLGGALFGGAQGVVHQGALELGAPETLARDLAALPESFGPEAPHLARNAPSALTPLAAGVTDVMSDIRGGGPNPLKAYHGTPHRFEPTESNPLGAFDLSKIGSGEGAQVYGHGAYLAENESIARHYRDALSPPAEPTLDFSGIGGPKGLDLANATDFAREFVLEHPDFDDVATSAPGQRRIVLGVNHAVDQFFKGKTRQEALDNLPTTPSFVHDDVNRAVEHTYDWLADAKLDPGGPKVGDEPFNEKDDAHKAAWYIHQVGDDHLAAIDQLDTERVNMEAAQKRGRNQFGAIPPDHYDAALARVKRLKDMIDQDQETGALPKYSEPDRGHMYEAEIQAHPEHLLHWDKKLTEQSDYVRQRLSDLGYAPEHLGWQEKDGVWTLHGANGEPLGSVHQDKDGVYYAYGPTGDHLGSSANRLLVMNNIQARTPAWSEMTGEEIYHDLSRRAGKIPEEPGGWGSVPGGTVQQYGTNPAKASEMLREAGIPALRYYDANSRREGLSLPQRISNAEFEVNHHREQLAEFERQRGTLEHGSPGWNTNELRLINAQTWLSEANRQLAKHRAALNDLRHNYVIFDPSTVNIIRRYGLAGVLGGGAAAAAGGPQSE